MVLRTYATAAFLVLASCSLHGQIRHMGDTIRCDLRKPCNPVITLDGKNSFIRDLKLKMYGVQAGYQYNRRTTVRLAFYTTFNKKKVIYDNPTARQGETDINTISNKFGMAYLSLEGEYHFFNQGKWRFSFPAGIGVGTGWNKFYKNNEHTKTNYALVIPIEMGFSASYKLSRWVWLGAGIGSRLSFASQRFNGPFFTYGLQFQMEEIIKSTERILESF